MSEVAGQTPYEFARAFFSFLEARAVGTGDCPSRQRADLPVPTPRAVTTGDRPRTSCGLCADSSPAHARLTCSACGEPIANGQAVTTSRLFEQRHWHPEHAPERPRIPEQRTGSHDADA